MALDVLVASGFTVSSAFALKRATFALYLPNSTTGAQVRVAFAPTLDANSGAFAVLQGDNTGAPYLVFSGGAALVSQPIPAVMPFARIVTTGAMGGPSSYQVQHLTIP